MRWLASVCLAVIPAAATPIYSVVDLGWANGPSYGTSLSENGIAGGWRSNGAGSDTGFITGNGGVGAGQTQVNGVNNGGRSVGTLFENGGSQATSWKNGVATPVAGSDSYATAINNGGQVTGSQGGQAFRFSGGTASNLAVGGGWSAGMAINNSGAVAGTRMTSTGIFQAFYWSPSGEIAWLTSPGVSGSYAFGMNDSGTVVGSLETASGYLNGYIWTARGVQQIGTLGGTMSGAYDVNNRGQVVGYAGLNNGTNAAFLWYAGSLLNLNAMIDPLTGWQLNEARAINDAGQIVGTGTYEGQRHAFLLNPMTSTPDVFAQSQTAVAHTPEPATLGLVGAALVGLGVLRSKRRA